MDRTANFLCIPYLNGQCNYVVCKNHHIEDIELSKSEYEKKGINRICYNYNFSICNHNPCKFLHLKINAVEFTKYINKVNVMLSPLRANLLRLEKMYANIESISHIVRSDIPKEIEEIYRLIYKKIELLNHELDSVLSYSI